MLVSVPATGQIAGGKYKARAAAEIYPFQARGLGEGRTVALFIGQIAQFVIRGIDRIVHRQFPERPGGKHQLDFVAKGVGKIGPPTTGVGQDRAAVH